jgi:hypothetical protein
MRYSIFNEASAFGFKGIKKLPRYGTGVCLIKTGVVLEFETYTSTKVYHT